MNNPKIGHLRQNSDDRPHGILTFSAYTLAACLTISGIGSALAQPGTQLTAYDTDGNELGLIGAADDYSDAVYSPDGRRIAATTISFPALTSSLRIIDSETGETTLIAESDADETVAQPVWYPDGREIAYVISGNTRSHIYRRVLDGDEEGQLLHFREGEEILLGDWSREGLLVFAAIDAFENESRLYLIDVESGSEPTELAEFEYPVRNPRFSPDGRYLSFFDNEGALFVMRATPATGSPRTWQLTSGDASGRFGPPPSFGFWDVDDPIFYQIEVDQGVRVIATPVDTTSDFEFGEPSEVLALPISVVTSTATLSPDGEQLLIAAEPPRQISVVDADAAQVASIGVPVRFSARAFSPDFRRVAAGMTQRLAENDTWDLYILDAETGEASLIGTGDGRGRGAPIWSPDGREVAFVALQGSRYNVYRWLVDEAIDGNGELIYSHEGGPIDLGDWSLDGRYLVFVSGRNDPISRLHVIDLESQREPLVVAEDTDDTMRSPRFSPDGRYLSYVRGTDEAEVYVTRAAPVTDDHDQAWQLTSNGTLSAGFWDSDDATLYYVDSERRVMALSVDTGGALESGDPRQIAMLPEDAVESSFTMRHDGERLLFERRPLEQRFRMPSTQIVVRDRNGEEIARVGAAGLYNQPTFSPDGSRILVARRDPDLLEPSTSLEIIDLASGETTQIAGADDDFDGTDPVWMADGEYVAYAVNGGMGRGEDGSWIYRIRADGQGEPEPLFRTALGVVSLNLTDVASADRFLLFDSFGVVQAVALAGDDPLVRQGIDVLRGEFEFGAASLSPDMRLIAYTYNEDERHEVYLSHFDAEAGTAIESQRYQVSDGVIPAMPFGAGFALNLPLIWRDDSQELYFSARGQVMAVSVSVEPSLQIGEPRPLFESAAQLQDVSADGQRFLFIVPALDTNETDTNDLAER